MLKRTEESLRDYLKTKSLGLFNKTNLLMTPLLLSRQLSLNLLVYKKRKSLAVAAVRVMDAARIRFSLIEKHGRRTQSSRILNSLIIFYKKIDFAPPRSGNLD